MRPNFRVVRCCFESELCAIARVWFSENPIFGLGDPTEGAILVATRKYNSRIKGIFERNHKVSELPFASGTDAYDVVYRDGITASYVKGSPDTMLELATHWMTPEDDVRLRLKTGLRFQAIYDNFFPGAARPRVRVPRSRSSGIDICR